MMILIGPNDILQQWLSKNETSDARRRQFKIEGAAS